MDEAHLLSERYELIREDHAKLGQLQPHQGLRGIIFSCLDIQHRLTVCKNPFIIRVAFFVYILQLDQNIFRTIESFDILFGHLMKRVHRHMPHYIPDKALVLIAAAYVVN